MTTTNKIFLQLLERNIGSNNRNKWTSWTIVTRVIAYYFTYLNVTDFSSFWFLGGSDTGLAPSIFIFIVILTNHYKCYSLLANYL